MSKIYISPSTQEHNQGAGNFGTEEQRMNQIADVVVPLLQFNHLEVYRNKPTMTLQQAVADSNSKNVDAHFAIHSNAGGARGCEVFYTSDRGKPLAAAVYKYVEALTPSSDRGVKRHEKLYELNKTKVTAALIEVAFHDNAQDADFIINNIQPLGEAIAHGICDYFGVQFKKPQPAKAAEPRGKLYKVQVGAFGVKENADKLVNELKTKGYNAIVVEG